MLLQKEIHKYYKYGNRKSLYYKPLRFYKLKRGWKTIKTEVDHEWNLLVAMHNIILKQSFFAL